MYMSLYAAVLFFVLTPVAIALAILTLFAAALIRRALSLIVVARRRAHVHRPHLPLPSQVDCCLFTPLAVGGVLGASSAPPIQRIRPTPPRRRSKNESPGLRSCGHRDGYPCARVARRAFADFVFRRAATIIVVVVVSRCAIARRAVAFIVDFVARHAVAIVVIVVIFARRNQPLPPPPPPPPPPPLLFAV